MKTGDLRRFNDNLVTLSFEENYEGCFFTVLTVVSLYGDTPVVDILVNGRIEKEWGYQWVESNSEPLDEAR